MNMATFRFVEIKEILNHLNAAKFFREYLPHIKMYKHKMRGTDGNGKDIDFTEEEKQQIVEAVQKFAAKVSKSKNKKGRKNYPS